MAVTEIARPIRISEPTFCRWKTKYADLGITEIGWVKKLEQENRKRKQLITDLSRDMRMLQDVVEGM